MNRYNYTTIELKGRIKRMKDIISMWRLVSFLKANRFSLALELNLIVSSIEAEREIHNTVKDEIKATQKKLGRQLTKSEKKRIKSEHELNIVGYSDYRANLRVNLYHKEAVVERSVLVERYLGKYVSDSNKEDFNEMHGDIRIQTRKIEVESTIQSCIEVENGGYIQIDKENPAFLLLTTKGKKFGTFGGLFKAIGHELSELVSEWNAVVYVTIALIGVLNIGLLKSITAPISPWW